MEMSDQLHAQAALLPGKEPSIANGEEAYEEIKRSLNMLNACYQSDQY
jgi:hypothetical protein